MSRLNAGRDGRTCLSRNTVLRLKRGQEKQNMFPVQLTTRTIGNVTWLVHTLLNMMTIHTYMDFHAPNPLTSGTVFRIPSLKLYRSSPFHELHDSCMQRLSVTAAFSQSDARERIRATSPPVSEETWQPCLEALADVVLSKPGYRGNYYFTSCYYLWLTTHFRIRARDMQKRLGSYLAHHTIY